MKRILFLMSFLLSTGAFPSQAKDLVLAMRIDGIINPVIGDYVADGIKEAENKKAAAVLIELDTPGGLLDTTRTVISAMLNTNLPVIVYVSPRGSRATSAGVFITMAADVAAMARETHIGAAHPVNIQGDTPSLPTLPGKPEKDEKKGEKAAPQKSGSVMEEKMVSDSAAYIRTLAKEHGRNADWAERAVRESISLTADEALAQKVIDLMADSPADLFAALEGKKIVKNNTTTILHLKDAVTENVPLSGVRKFLHILGHPNVAYILLTIGIYGLIYEFAHPGIGLGGVVGAICLLLAFFSLQVLPINTVGIILLAIAFILFVSELFTPTHGVLTIGGLISFTFGSFMLIDVKRDLSIPRVSAELILPTVFVTALFFGVVIRKIIAARRMRPRVGAETLVGTVGEVREGFNPEGLVFLHGELWMAKAEGPLN
ncbi:MAG: nodulation protein NfeD, partial [Elusimicrobia bacterium]|nr:nodulation protein NfeD [Candidatus Obscuribacterium magneticum]